MNSRKLASFTNCIKGIFCGVLVWLLLFLVYRYGLSIGFLGAFRTPMLILGPPVMFPFVLWTVLHFQLPPLSTEYIKKKWMLWIPGYVVACLPSIDILILDRFLIDLLMS
jgi:hypothetical protein